MIKPPDGLAIEATGLVKTFGKIRALDGIVLAVPPASCTRCWARTERARDHGDPGPADAGTPSVCALRAGRLALPRPGRASAGLPGAPALVAALDITSRTQQAH